MKHSLLLRPLLFSWLCLFFTPFLINAHPDIPDTKSYFIESIEAGEDMAVACAVPTWPSTSNITQTSATFSWSPVAGAYSYSVQTRLPGGTWYNAPGSPFTSTTVTVQGFSPGTTYEWRVSANCSYGESSYWTYPITFTTLSGSCDPPTWLSTNYITETSATLQWSSAPGAVSYSIQWRPVGSSWIDLPGGPWTTTWVFMGGLTPGTTYEWRVRSNCGYGMQSSWSYTTSFTTLGYSCATPTWPSTSNITQTSATFSWSPVSGAHNYTIQTRLENGTWYDVPGGPFSQTTVTVTGFSPGTTYQWRVRANCGYYQHSAWTWPITFTTQGGSSCYAPSWTYTTNITSHSATLNWSHATGAVSYTIQWRYAGGYWNELSAFYDTWYTLTGLQPGTAYEWRIRSNCHYGGHSYWSNINSFTTLGYSCATPTWPSTYNITSTTATVSWSAVSGAHSYTIQLRQSNGYWYDVPNGPFYQTSVTLTGLTPGTSYQWRVRANCGYGQYSHYTSPIYFTTLGESSCHAPYWTYTSNITQHSATLNWTHASGAHSYTIQWRHSGGGSWNELPALYDTWYTLTGLYPATTYEWRIRSNCHYGGHSAWSYNIQFTTLGQSCSTPTWPSTYNITQTSATFSWSPVSGAHSYSVEIRQYGGSWTTVYGSPTTGSWITATGLQPGTTYEWRVRANCGYGQYSYWITPITFTTLAGSYCHTPYWLSTTSITQTSATLNWSSVSGAYHYSIQYRQLGSYSWIDVPGPITGTWYSLTGLHSATTYEWRIKSNCHYGGYSSWSSSKVFTTLGSSCQVPGWPSTSQITQSSATFSWSHVPGAHHYAVQMREPNGIWTDIAQNPIFQTSVTVTGLQPNTTYQWRVKTSCSSGYGGGNFSNWTYPTTFTTLGGSYCHAPSGLHTTQIAEASARLNWTAVGSALSYSIQWRYTGGHWQDVSGDVTGTWYVLTGLAPGTGYQWRVRSNCDGSYSQWSSFVSFTTLEADCVTPEGLTTTNVTENEATLSWTPVPFAQNYSVQLRVPSGSWATVPGSPFTDTTVTAVNLNPGTIYEWRVRANCGYSNQSPWPTPVSFTTEGSGDYGNDECVNATLLYVNSECVNTPASNIGATLSTPAPMGWCPNNNHKDVWFKFTMPDVPDPVVTIRTTGGTLTDAVMEIYSGDCSNLTYVTCEDDNTSGNGSPMPVISLNGNPNTTVWVRVWGYAGTTGTFNICVFNYYSVNMVVPDIVTLPDGAPIGTISELPVNAGDNVTMPTPRLSPNPAKDILYITMPQTKEVMVNRIVMTDISGKVVLQQGYSADTEIVFEDRLDVSGLSPGLYLVRIMTTSGMMTEKIVIANR